MSSLAPLPTAELAVLGVPAHWQRIDFLSDLHLEAGMPRTFGAWRDHLLHTPAQAVFLLGDIFEVWVGDDATDDFSRRCAEVLREASATRAVYFMPGNRDFLIGPAWLEPLGVERLPDPCVLAFENGPRCLLSHGDALCLNDPDYLRFRAQVRAPDWQQTFLAQPRAAREAIAQQLRRQSRAHQAQAMQAAEVDADAARQWLGHGGATTLVHGHTHRPADHTLAPGMMRRVLSDWDLEDSAHARAEVLTCQASPAGWQWSRQKPSGA